MLSGAAQVARQETASSCALNAPKARPCCVAYTCSNTVLSAS